MGHQFHEYAPATPYCLSPQLTKFKINKGLKSVTDSPSSKKSSSKAPKFFQPAPTAFPGSSQNHPHSGPKQNEKSTTASPSPQKLPHGLLGRPTSSSIRSSFLTTALPDNSQNYFPSGPRISTI
ncbi:hypothetical protein JTB14_037923 [Gonioctena quinquepunctata]|nr:hypothetical protein JTB14_037923 [Gonioctena quinquepunctata]